MNTKFFSFDGRSKRSGYWGVSFGTFFVLVVVMTVLDALFPGVGEQPSNVSLVIFMIVLIPYSWINLAVQIRRWHDLDRSGWMMLIGLIPVIGAIVLVVVLGFFPSTPGENRYGIGLD